MSLILDTLKEYGIPTDSIKAIPDIKLLEEAGKLDYETLLREMTSSKSVLELGKPHDIKYTALYLVQEAIRSPDKDYDVLLPIAQEKARAFIEKNMRMLIARGEIDDTDTAEQTNQNDIQTIEKEPKVKQKRDGRMKLAVQVFDDNIDHIKTRKEMLEIIVNQTGVKENSAAVVIYNECKKRGIKLIK